MTREQFIRSNKAAYPLVMLTNLMVVLTLLGAVAVNGMTANLLLQIIGLVGCMLLATVMFLTKKTAKLV